MNGRHAAPFIRDVLARFRRQALPAREAASELGLSRSRFYCLYADYLRACARADAAPLAAEEFPAATALRSGLRWVLALLRKLLSADPPASYSFAASEVHRRHALKLDRATVRRWALRQKLAPETGHKKRPKPVRAEQWPNGPSAPSYARRRAAHGGLTSGACAPKPGSAQTAASPSRPNACASSSRPTPASQFRPVGDTLIPPKTPLL